MKQETRNCRNCKASFIIDADDFAFYEKIGVPPPTWCPECRMVRRFLWRNERQLFRRPDSRTGEMIFSSVPKDAPTPVYERDFWWSDGWDPLQHGREYDFSRPFFKQFQELMVSVPWPSRSVLNLTASEYTANLTEAKNAYLCFSGFGIENSAYVVNFTTVKEGFDLYQSRHSELCYDCYMVDEAYRVFYSVNCEDCTDIWFSKNMLGCSNCFGCMNLRNKQYHIFNKPVPKEEYRKFITAFSSGSFTAVTEVRKRAEAFWLSFPHKFVLSIQAMNSTGEHIEHTKNVKRGYFIHEAEHMAYCQLAEERVSDSYDCTVLKENASECYESVVSAIGASRIKFGFSNYSTVRDLEYSIFCPGSSDCFACIGLRKKQYCILNKQYSKEEYFELRKKIIAHMNEMPYVSQRAGSKERIAYKYGEFFPPELSPFAYNETIAQDFFPLTKAEAEARGYLWRKADAKEHVATIKAENLPDHIEDASDDILKDTIACGDCGKAYRIIPMELEFLRRIPLPLPRKCPECRFKNRFRFVNPPKFWPGRCECNGQGAKSKGHGAYENQAKHAHGENSCLNTFETSYAPGRPEIIYCEPCYNTEVA